MNLRRALLAVMLTLLAAVNVAVPASATIGCAAPEVAIAVCADQPSDCDTNAAPDCALACAPMCAAVEPSVAAIAQPEWMAAAYFAPRASGRLHDYAGPDPPPPRVAWVDISNHHSIGET